LSYGRHRCTYPVQVAVMVRTIVVMGMLKPSRLDAVSWECMSRTVSRTVQSAE
jgi:hypothetical protein